MVGDPGIEPGVGLPGGVTIRCRTLQPVAHSDAFASLCAGWIQVQWGGVNRKIACISTNRKARKGRSEKRDIWS